MGDFHVLHLITVDETYRIMAKVYVLTSRST